MTLALAEPLPAGDRGGHEGIGTFAVHQASQGIPDDVAYVLLDGEAGLVESAYRAQAARLVAIRQALLTYGLDPWPASFVLRELAAPASRVAMIRSIAASNSLLGRAVS